MKLTKNNIFTARFTDVERTTIEVLLKEGKHYIPYILEYNPEHPDCQDLLAIIDLDTLHENTYIHNQESRASFENTVKEIAKKEGIMTSMELEVNKEFFTEFFKWIYADEVDADKMFALKIQCFDLEIVKKQSEKVKSEIRNLQTPKEILYKVLGLK